MSRRSRSWDPVADWYAGWVGEKGSRHHQELALPTAMELLEPAPGERILDLGCGTGALSRPIVATGASYTGVDLSQRLVRFARRHQAKDARFVVGDATRLFEEPPLGEGRFEAVIFLLSIQDIEPLSEALASARKALAPGGRLVIVMTHPCFRVPRQSGWGFDPGRKLRYRRVDHYLSDLAVPMKPYPGGGGRSGRSGATRSYHRPLQGYVGELLKTGLVVDRLVEVPQSPHPGASRTERRAHREIPLFLGLRAIERPR